MCVSCLTTTLDSQSLECESTYTPARRVALFSEHFVAPTASAGCVFFSTKSFVQQILINMLFISFEISSHFSCLLPAVSLSILFTPMLICFTFKRLLIIECWLELLLRRLLRLRSCRIVNVSSWSNQGQRDCTVLLSTVSRVSQQSLIHGQWNVRALALHEVSLCYPLSLLTCSDNFYCQMILMVLLYWHDASFALPDVQLS